MSGQVVSIAADGVTLEAALSLPARARGLVLFAHGSGSSRLSPRNRFVAGALEEAGLGTLLFDLLTPAEEEIDRVTRKLRFDIPFLSERLLRAVDWAAAAPATRDLRLGLFGASTGAAAALTVAAYRPEVVFAVVSRGGRPDLARAALPNVAAPVLLIVGGNDRAVLELNRAAAAVWPHARVEVVAGASHLFDEAGALAAVARLAVSWFEARLGTAFADEAPPLPFVDRQEAGTLLGRRLSCTRGGPTSSSSASRAAVSPSRSGWPRCSGRRSMRSSWASSPRRGDEAAAARDQAELVRRERAYRGQRPPPAVGGKVTILVDDGLATGATMRAAVAWARRNFAAKVVVAVPIGSRAAVDRLKDEADQVVCLAVLE